jgi:hypothetical protein
VAAQSSFGSRIHSVLKAGVAAAMVLGSVTHLPHSPAPRCIHGNGWWLACQWTHEVLSGPFFSTSSIRYRIPRNMVLGTQHVLYLWHT